MEETKTTKKTKKVKLEEIAEVTEPVETEVQGNYTGTNPRSFADTLWIDEVTEEHLVLKDFGNYSVTYQRKVE